MAHTPAVYRRRRIMAVVALAVATALAVFAIIQLTGSTAAEPPSTTPAVKAQATPTPKPLSELPRGGRQILPHFRVVAYYGAPQDDELGALGIGSPASAAKNRARQAKSYARKSRPVLPAMEL